MSLWLNVPYPSEGCIDQGQVGVLLNNGDGTFQPAVNYGSGADFPTSVAVADVNGDGKLDVLVANGATGTHGEEDGAVGVLLGNGDGTFQTAVIYDSGGGSDPSVAVADVNGDGKPDLVVIDSGNTDGQCSNNSSAASVLLGNGDGTFQTAVLYCSGGSSADAVAVADVNGDGEPDLVVANACSDSSCDTGSVGVLINTSAIAVLSPISLGFGSQSLGTTSAPQNATLTNTGNFSTTLKISSIGITGANSSEFAQTNNCGPSLSPGGSCSVMVTFTPTAFGSASASLNVTDNVTGSPQSVALTGFGQGPGISLSPSNVSFPSQYVGTSGLPQSVKLMNIGNTALTITNVAASTRDFASLSTCGNSVAPGASCSIGVFFDPTTSGTRNGTLMVTDSASGSPQTAALTGIGQDFSLAPGSQPTASVSPGQSASYKVVVAPGGGFNQTVTLSCSGAPAQSICSVSPSLVKLSVSAAMATVTVTTAGGSAGLTQPISGSPAGSMFGSWLALSGAMRLAMLGSLAGWRRERRPRLFYGIAFLCVLSLGVTMPGCGGGGSGSSSSGGSGTQAGTYDLTVTGSFTSGSTTLTHNTQLTLVVK